MTPPPAERDESPTEAPGDASAATERLRARLAAVPLDVALVTRLARALGDAAVAPLLDALSGAPERDARALLDLLATLGPAVGEQCTARLAAAPASPHRLLAVIARIPELPAAFSATPYTAHAHPDVRREAFKILLRRPGTRDLAICTAIDDADERLVLSGVSGAAAGCPERAVPLLMRRADDAALRPELRVLAVRALGTVRQDAVRDWLVARARGRRRFGGRARLAPTSPDLLATLAVLATIWQGDPAAEAVLAVARRSPDVEVRLATALRAQGLAGPPTPTAGIPSWRPRS